MTFINLDCLHLEVRQPTFIHEEMNGRYEVSQIRIDTGIIVKNLLKMNNIVKSSLKIKNIGHITNENTFMMCPTFYLVNP